MAAHCNLVVNGRRIRARSGQTLVDAATSGGVVIPHDCCTGECETCAVRVLGGRLDDAGTGDGFTVLACQAKLTGDVSIEYDEVPPLRRCRAQVRSMRLLSPQIAEVVLALAAPLAWLPGQYVKVAFAGFPARDYSPAPTEDGRIDPHQLVLHVRIMPGGLVSDELGRAIGLGHRATVHGPFGQAFHRPGSQRLVLVSSGTGWAPIFAIARQACLTEPGRPVSLIASARDARDLYMRRSLVWLGAHGLRDIVLTASSGGDGAAWSGRAVDYIDSLRPTDVVHVAGAPGLVNAVRARAAAAGALCHADPFLPSSGGLTIGQRMHRWMRQMRPRPARVRLQPAE
jgi:3-phenylpropionate/trans-cinnamate dioxygenase ferredoxin reductase subunit